MIRWIGEPMGNIAKKKVTHAKLYNMCRGFGGDDMNNEGMDALTRVFILALVGSTILCDKAGAIYLYYMPSLKDVSSIS